MEVVGYKCFNKDLTNRYGVKFEVGKIYIAKGPIKYGNNGNGYHLCKNFEDTFRYFDAFNSEVKICKVKGSEEILESFDDYNEYYQMYVVRKLEILRLLTRKEIINLGLKLDEEFRVTRFISGFKLTEDEIKLFEQKYSKNNIVLKTIDYFQRKNLSSYRGGAKIYGQYSNKGSKRE